MCKTQHFVLSKCAEHNKANLVKGVGGEAARQKDINSLSEFNKRGGGGSGTKMRRRKGR